MTIHLCGKCGKIINEDYIYCPWCGARIDESGKNEIALTIPAGITGISIEVNSGKKRREEAPPREKGSFGRGGIDVVYVEALKYVAEMKVASVSMIQRQFPIGYVKACKIIDWMEDMNYITPNNEEGIRKVLKKKKKVKEMFGGANEL